MKQINLKNDCKEQVYSRNPLLDDFFVLEKYHEGEERQKRLEVKYESSFERQRFEAQCGVA